MNPKSTKEVFLSDVWAQAMNSNWTSNLDDFTTILTDPDLYDKARGLLPRKMSLDTFLSILHPKSLVQQARRVFLITGKVTAKDLVPAENFQLFYAEQMKRRKLSLKVDEDTVKELALSINDKEIPKALANWIDEDEYKELLSNNISDMLNNLNEALVPNPIAEDMNSLLDVLKQRSDCFTIHMGYAGCGKSTAVAKIVNEKCGGTKAIVVSLSNTIGQMFKQKVPEITPFSCTGAAFALAKDSNDKIRNNEIVVIDEFSQWGYEHAVLLKKLFQENPCAEFHIMGDIHQIPTFLGCGSLLYSMMKEFPHNVKRYETQYRFLNNPDYLNFLQGVQKGEVKTCPFLIRSLAPEVLKLADVCITGSNKNVARYNRLMFEAKWGTDKNYFENPISMRAKVSLLVSECPDLPLIADATEKLANGKKIRRNEKFRVGARVSANCSLIKRELDDSSLLVNDRELDDYFSLGYAITVNRSQGLEWDNVLVAMNPQDGNLMNQSALYVALSRGKYQLWYIDTNAYADPIAKMNENLRKRWSFTNNFAECSDINMNTQNDN